jgi:CHAD domain-containing protein
MPVGRLRARLAEQPRELEIHAEVAPADTDPEGVHRLRAAVAAVGPDPSGEELHDLRILGKRWHVTEMATGKEGPCWWRP